MRKIFTILTILVFGNSFAQDIHFSQFNDFPLQINPALSGNMDGTIRGGLIYRNQWNSVSVPFESTGLFTDFKLSPSFLNDKTIGLGVQILNDRSGSGSLTENDLKVTLSYQHFLNFKKTRVVTGGISLGAFQKSYDFSQLNFESQFIYSSADFSSGGSMENFTNTSFIKPDVGIGISYSAFEINGHSFSVGMAAAHLNMPRNTFLGDNGERLGIKYVLHGNGIYKLNKKIDLAPSFLYMNQNRAQLIIVGSDLIYSLGRQTVEKIDLKTGLFYRGGDALFAVIGLNHDNWSLDLGYDINLSGLSPASGYKGAFELSIGYVNRVFRGNKSQNFVVPGNNLL